MDLKNYRTSCSLTQQQLAEAVGLSRYQISRYERGLGCPSSRVVRRIQEQLGFPLDQPHRGQCNSPKVRRCFGSNPEKLGAPANSAAWGRVAKHHPDLVCRLGQPPPGLSAWIRTDSSLECLAWMQLHFAGGLLLFESPALLGYSSHPLCAETGFTLGTDLLPCLFLARLKLLIWPQVNIRGPHRSFRVDGLALVRTGPRNRWVVVEIDGAGHRPDYDLYRTDSLQMPVLRFATPDIMSLEFVDRLEKKLLQNPPPID